MILCGAQCVRGLNINRLSKRIVGNSTMGQPWNKGMGIAVLAGPPGSAPSATTPARIFKLGFRTSTVADWRHLLDTDVSDSVFPYIAQSPLPNYDTRSPFA